MTGATLQEALSRAISVQLTRLHRSRNWLADELGMSPGSLYSRLTGRTMLDTEDIDAIACVIGMTGFDLLARASLVTRGEPAPLLEKKAPLGLGLS